VLQHTPQTADICLRPYRLLGMRCLLLDCCWLLEQMLACGLWGVHQAAALV
jgi:hypothetical protein